MPLPNTQLDYLRRITTASRRAVVEVTPVLDTGAYAVDDNLCLIQTIPGSTSNANNTTELSSLTITSGISTAVALVIYVFDRTVTLAAPNAAFTLTDADMKFCQAVISIATGDWVVGETGGNAVVMKSNLDMHLKPNVGQNLFFAVKINTIATYGASDLVFKFGFQY
jgi:hypothetical protein